MPGQQERPVSRRVRLSCWRVAWSCVLVVACSAGPQNGGVPRIQLAATADSVYLVIRSDDGGMSHAVNMGIKQLLETGLPVSVSVMFACPWQQEIVEILRQHPEAAVGVHLTLNSEWRNYRWGPVIGRAAAPTLVDKDGYFFPSSEDLYQNHPDLGQVERELRAQIERALASGLHIDYLDYHMGTALGDPKIRAIVERLASEYDLGLMNYYGDDRFNPQYSVDPAAQVDTVVAALGRLKPGYHVLVTHIGLDTPELAALVDMNTGQPLADMSQHRQGELNAVTSAAFRQAVADDGITLITYRDLLSRVRAAGQTSPTQ
jgi:predicted glycoside hydrolase/deacetylase ChbG (UPF0249 family)